MFFLFQLLLQCFFISITKYILITFSFLASSKLILYKNGIKRKWYALMD